MPLRWKLRPGKSEDHPFVYSSFLRSYIASLTPPARARVRIKCGRCSAEHSPSVSDLAALCPDCSTPIKGLVLELGDFEALHTDLEARLDSCRLLVACGESEAETILGWALFNEGESELIYVYTKQNYRSQGVASSLIEALLRKPGRVFYPYSTRQGAQLAMRIMDARAPGEITFCHMP